MEELFEERMARIETIAKQVVLFRDEAIKGRQSEGIENEWDEDDEYYEGIDDVNRHSVGANYSKPSSSTGVVEAKRSNTGDNKCIAFFNVLRQFVDTAAARMGDMLIPAADWNFTIKETPVPEFPGDIEKSKTRLHDWLIETKYRAELRKVVEDGARIGTGVLKGPVPAKKISKKITTTEGDTTVQIIKSTVPESKSINPRNCYPDPSCGNNIHKGSYFFERDDISAKSLIDLKGTPGYLSHQIDLVIEEGPGKKNVNTGNTTSFKDMYEIWYGYVMLKISDLVELECECKVNGDPNKLIPAVVTLVNDRPIKAFLNPLDTGEFPYDFFTWQRRKDSPWGIGVCRQGRTGQDMINGACRTLMENAGLSAKPIIIIRNRAIQPVDGNWNLYGGKVLVASEESDIRSVSDAILAINIPMVQREMQAIIELGYKMLEDSTGIFFIMQGQQGAAPDTVGGMEILHKNSSAVLRRLSRNFDEQITENHIPRYYEYLLMYGEDDEKADLKIEAIGATSLVENEINMLRAQGLLAASLNPAFGLDPEKAMGEVLKSQRMAPEKWQLDDEKKQELMNRPPPEDPRVTVAHIKAEVDKFKTEVMATLQDHKLRVDMDRDMVYSQGVANRDIANERYNYAKLGLQRDLALLDYAKAHNIKLEDVKAKLTDTVMKLDLQERLATQVITPAIEPPGRAPDGQAFQK